MSKPKNYESGVPQTEQEYLKLLTEEKKIIEGLYGKNYEGEIDPSFIKMPAESVLSENIKGFGRKVYAVLQESPKAEEDGFLENTTAHQIDELFNEIDPDVQEFYLED